MSVNKTKQRSQVTKLKKFLSFYKSLDVGGGLKPIVEKENRPQNGNFGNGNGSLLSTPVWLQEIKSNEIFNKRKKISSIDDTEGEIDNEDVEDDGNEGDDEYPDVKVLHKTIDTNLMSKKEYVY